MEFLAKNIVPYIWIIGVCFGVFGAFCVINERRKYKKFDEEQLAKASKKNNK